MTMNNLLVKDEIENMIYQIRGKQVMLDSDLAKLYNCKNGTKTINQAVSRHINRFPERFMFQLTYEEYYGLLRSQVGTLELERGKYSKYLPYVFTEQGVAMLSAVLRTDIAEDVSIRIMDAFVKMKNYLLTENNIINNIERKMLFYDTKLIEHDDKFETLFNQFRTKNNHIFFEEEIYDAYSLLIDILSKAKDEIIIIDNYASKELFDILKNIKTNIKIVTKNIDDTLIKKYQKQYNNIEIINKDNFHDRFIIIDNSILYHSGASFKDLGKKCFSINKIEDKEYLERIINKIKGD